MNKDYLKQLKEIFRVDQEARLKCKPGLELPNYLVYTLDIAHNYSLRLLINQYGYPDIKLIGKRGMKLFHLLILHQSFDIKLQEECLENCNFSLELKAELIDRIRFNKGEKQLYGTMLIGEIEDKKNVNKRRKKVGLSTLEEYLKFSNKEIKKIQKIKKFDYYKIK